MVNLIPIVVNLGVESTVKQYSLDVESNVKEYALGVDVAIKAVQGEHYTGDYIVTPQAREDTVLETANKLLDNDITVLKIPYYETGNTSGGDTVYIGSEV